MYAAFGEDEQIPAPVELEDGDDLYLELFQRFTSIRHAGEMGAVHPIQPDQITSWSILWGIRLTTQEVQLILDLDSTYRASIARERERNRPKKQTE